MPRFSFHQYFIPLLTAFILSAQGIVAQVYSLNNGVTNGSIISTCSGRFYDSNVSGNYNNGEHYTVTFSPLTTGQAIELQFEDMALGLGDTLWVYDGLNISAPLLYSFTRREGILSLRATTGNPTGSLTIRFYSDHADVNRGWSAIIRCKNPCQQFEANIDFSMPQADAEGYINICAGDQIILNGEGNYLQNDLFYHQSDQLSRFSWRVTDSKDTSGIALQTFTHRFANQGGYLVELTVTDTAGCTNINRANVKVRTGITPGFNVNLPPLQCTDDTIKVAASPSMKSGNFSNPPIIADSIFLPDGINVAYQSTLNITQFSPGQTLNNINDLEGILLNLEHSWLGDITIAIKAPNGTIVRLKNTVGISSGWDTYLGEPVDEPSPTHPFATIGGKGYDYFFSPNPTYGTMANERGKYTYSYTDNAGQQVIDRYYLPEGSYTSEESLQALLGTSLNGLWTITVIDNFAEDNGKLFYWTIKFNSSLYPVSEEYSPAFHSGNWHKLPQVMQSTDTTAALLFDAGGAYPFTYTITDEYGCDFDTTFAITVLTSPGKPALGADTTICEGKNVALSVINPSSSLVYSWSNGAQQPSTSASAQGMYWVEAVNAEGCRNRDTIVVQYHPSFTVKLGNDTTYCNTAPLQLQPVASTANITYRWNNNTTGTTLPLTGPGLYWLDATDENGCTVRDSIVVTDNPINSFALPRDTSICLNTIYTIRLQPPAGTHITWHNGTTGPNLSTGSGQVSLVADHQGCVVSSQMHIGEKPLPVFSLGKDTSICPGSSIPLAIPIIADKYLWSTGSNSQHITAAAGAYHATAWVDGCPFTDTIAVDYKVCECTVNIPNAFSPNGDGINEFFIPVIDCFPAQYNLSIFNRYGQLIYTSRDFNNRWDGKVNGSPLPVATYYYILTFYNQNLNKQEKYSGSITLLR